MGEEVIRLWLLLLCALALATGAYVGAALLFMFAGFFQVWLWLEEWREDKRFQKLSAETERSKQTPFDDWDQEYAVRYAPKGELYKIPEGATPIYSVTGLLGYSYPITSRHGLPGIAINGVPNEEDMREEYTRQQLKTL